jgi:hypothetical protein
MGWIGLLDEYRFQNKKSIKEIGFRAKSNSVKPKKRTDQQNR